MYIIRVSQFLSDSDRFGTKMLEKMGWSKGKGLGANLDGSLNFIKVAHKDNQKGMGFKDRDDQWTQHEDNFNALLKSFETGGSSGVVGSDGKDEADDSAGESSPGRIGFGFKSAEPKPTKESVFSGVSLEEQSKKSRSRVHYKKFTRGKDMARYSEQDLANIFGKRSLGDKHNHAAEAEAETVSKEQEDDTPAETEEKTFGVTVIKTGLSVTDYFKAKMDAMRANRKGPDGAKSSNPFYVYQPEKVTLSFPREDSVEDETPIEISSETVSKKKRKRDAEEQVEAEQSEEPIKKVKKSKKKSKQTDEELQLVENGLEHQIEDQTPEQNDLEKKKSKKKSKNAEGESLIVESSPELHIDSDVPEKKKSKKKSKPTAEDESVVIELEVDQTTELDVPEKKKSKKKSKRTDVENVLVEITQDVSNDDQVVKDKKNKRKNTEDGDNDSANTEEATRKSRKSKKTKQPDEVENDPILIADNDQPEASSSALKKSKKSREVIKTQPLHIPKFVSNVLTSLYDPKIAEVKQPELEASSSTSTPAASTPTANAASAGHSPSTILDETYELAKFKAEVFRFFDLGGFPGSTLGDIVGYGYSQNLQLKVMTNWRDDERITNFWDLALVNKYGVDAMQIKKITKKKKYNIKSLEKKNVFKLR